jgi:hypothetical protein
MSDSSQILNTDESSSLCIEQTEEVVDVLPGVVLNESGGEEVDELFEGNIASALRIKIEDNLVNRLVAGVRA